MPENSQKTAAIVLAAGKGVRMKSDLPKVLHDIDGRPLICYLADTLKQIDLDRIIIVFGYKKELVEEKLQGFDFEFVEQAERLGTGHAVMMAEKALDGFTGDVLVLLGDVPFLRRETILSLLREHTNRSAAATVLTSVPPDPTGYGRVLRNREGLVRKIVEHKDTTEEEKKITEINTGTMIFKKTELFEALKLLENNNVQGEYYLTDLMEIFLRQGKITAAFRTDDYREALGINSKQQLEELKRAYNK